MKSQFQITALVDTTPGRAEELAARHAPDATCAQTFEDMAEKADIALVATPPQTHQSIVSSLLEQGLHVLVEKPLARTSAECSAIVRAAQASGRSVFVGYNRRYFRGWRMLKEMVERNTAGPLLSLDAEEGTLFDWPVGSASIFDPAVAGGGTMLDTGVHELDLVLWLANGEPRVLFYEDDNHGGVEANAHAILADGDRTFRLRLSRTHTLQNRVVANFLNAIITAECWDPDGVAIYSQDPVVERAAKKVYAEVEASLGKDPVVSEWMGVWERLSRGEWYVDEAAVRAISLLEEMYAGRRQMDEPWVAAPREMEGVR